MSDALHDLNFKFGSIALSIFLQGNVTVNISLSKESIL